VRLGRFRPLAPWALAGLAGLAAVVVLHAWQPAGGASHSICIFRRTTGIPCPGCGLTRAFAQLAKGHWRAGVAAHPLAPLFALEAAAAWLAWGWLAARRGEVPGAWAARLPPLALAHAGALFALWLGRLATGTLPW